MAKAKPAEIAKAIKELADEYGWRIIIRGDILTIKKRITIGSNDELVTADMQYGSILGRLPRTSPGSDWGTDCGGIGALTALNTGVFTMNRSGGSKLVLKALAKIV